MIDDHKIDKKKIEDQVNQSDLVFIGISVPNNSQSES